ncbi:3-oxoacyl-ACP reductase [Sphingobium amiense]|uniref:3-oxoacyl-ACP reductase n=1 Tax=Sphingobium amiense TaxID=135719 RepID=A0A494WDD7_9SPHN|nr:glucose 1-dehydrogenase [Sphingobium amiense]BBD98389.1 3-oxoacyl-ACP reductase [Sphingobium amiense]
MDLSLYLDDDLAKIPGLKDKSIIVTGASSGIGRAASFILAKAGARLILADRDETGGRETLDIVRDTGGTADFVAADMASEASVQNMVAAAVSAYGRLDGAFNNAAVVQTGEFHETSDEEFQRVLDINLSGVFYCMKHQIIEMLKTGGGSIVNTSSLTGICAFGKNAAYAASKFGVVGLTLTGAHDYGDRGIRVNAVCPGRSRPSAMSKEGGNSSPEQNARRLRQIPLGRAGIPRELAQAAAWLLSDGASYVTGVIMPVDGGIMTGPYYKVEDAAALE